MGNSLAAATQFFPPKPRWTVNDIPDLSNKVMLVTGGNTGLGKETVKALLARNAKVYLAARDASKAQQAIADLRAETGKDAIFLELDLANLASVRRSAEAFLKQESALHALFLNAAVMYPPIEAVTVDGFDLQFGTNVVGHFLLTELLMPALLAGAESSPDRKARVVTTSSFANYLYTLNWDSFVDGPARKRMSTYDLYSQSKHANVVVAKEIARRYGDRGIVSTSVNPGNLRTDLQRHLSGPRKFIISMLLYPASYGALTQLWAGTSPEAADFNGKFLIPWARVGAARKEALDPEVGRRLWEWLETQCRPK
ncbi:NAD(P)-binding protein [Punctularia strigosozonata HHB-11173 SS5]|uniref:NAD(P)-binding protein n=1 Tax=Punctularia strigosozonata (strain HHB-11173) TaxID=741275 RepID=UPI00044169CE|nr:NAD(P)-binding protein [Punctularia strigosozonata HHB-11173 SS5]EIN09199.1 NAD(P)-binding protein [Punctularia strigosozonata HHB-11173 SS5]